MATTAHPSGEIGLKRAARNGYPASSAQFDALMAALSAIFLVGLWVDGWAHFHGRVDDSFFTPWHLVFYSAYALCAIVLGLRQFRGVGEGYAFMRALPRGYAGSMIGVVLFGFGGVGDMVWHTLFGIESGTEALLSPTHILLAAGMVLILTGPMRSAWARANAGEILEGWRGLAPMVASATLLLTLLVFFTTYAHPLTKPLAHQLPRTGGMISQDFGVTAILLESGVLAGLAGILLFRWRLPAGAIFLIAGISAGMLTILVDSYPFLPPLAVALIVVEILIYRLKPSPSRPAAFVFVLAMLPALFYVAYFAAIHLTVGRIFWSIHVWTGAIVLAGVVGALVGWALMSLRAPSETA